MTSMITMEGISKGKKVVYVSIFGNLCWQAVLFLPVLVRLSPSHESVFLPLVVTNLSM